MDASEMDFKKFENRTEYVSIIITYVNVPHIPEARRWELLENCVNSIHKHANYPFEIIVVDDSGLDLTSLNVKDKISTLILNMGKNLGQPVQTNRGINVASSKYIVVIEDDLEVIRPCFREIADILDKPYVGFINMEGIDSPGEYLKSKDTKFIIGGSLGGACFNAFRKDVWRELGGYPEWSTSSHPPFCNQILKQGYWRAYLVGGNLARDVDNEDYNNTRSTHLCGTTMHFPTVFLMPEDKHKLLSRERTQLSHENYDRRGLPASVSNFPYWRDWHTAVTPNIREHCVSSINWEAASIHGQSKWKEIILAEEVYHT